MPRKIKMAVREEIRALLDKGKTQVEIGDILNRTPATIAHHVRALGIAPKEYTKHRAKRRCASCGKMKTLGAFPNERQSECTVCVRAKKK